MRLPLRDSIGPRIAAAAVGVALVSVAILAAGVLVAGGASFTDLMIGHGEDAVVAHQMFDDTVVRVLVVAIVVALVTAASLAAILGRRLARPVRDAARAARRIAEGDYAARLPRRGPEELLSLSDSFNQMAASLQEQERMRREFIANAAHELRTPLTNLQGYLEALRDGVIAGDAATFDSLWEETDRLVRLARSLDLLAVGATAGDRRAPAELDLAAAVSTAVDLVRPAARTAGLELVVDLPGRLPARFDPDQLAQVLGNLLQNAVRYTPGGGRVTVAAEARPDDVLVSVTNTGAPIPADDVAHVFERFYRVDKSRDRASGGAGIGLAIVKQLVEAAGGRVGAESTAARTRFWFTLPAGGG
jgi:two-component system, OmpR family, sensor histidine kinase BaeS